LQTRCAQKRAAYSKSHPSAAGVDLLRRGLFG
jgi:hypothetical protein